MGGVWPSRAPTRFRSLASSDRLPAADQLPILDDFLYKAEAPHPLAPAHRRLERLTCFSSSPTSSSRSALTPPSPPPTLVPSMLGSGAWPERGAMYSDEVELRPLSEPASLSASERDGSDCVGELESESEKSEGDIAVAVERRGWGGVSKSESLPSGKIEKGRAGTAEW